MFDEFRKDLEKYSKITPEIFARVAKQGAVKFVNKAKDLTDKEGAVDTGNYKRNWFAEAVNFKEENYVICENNVDYASHIEEGYTLKKDQFIPFDKMEGTPKTKALIAKLKAKYPNAKGFTRKAGKYKGKFIGRQAFDYAYYYCIKQLQKNLDKLIKNKLKKSK